MLLTQTDVNPRCLDIMAVHSRCVWKKAERVGKNSRFFDCIDYQFLHEAAMLHDYGIIYVDAPWIFCFGKAPYICHGLFGAAHLRQIDARKYARHARVCEVHIGSGLSAAEIRRQGLPLPEKDFLPQTLEEKLITFADCFYSKNPESLCEEKPLERIRANMEKHGNETLERFLALERLFEPTA